MALPLHARLCCAGLAQACAAELGKKPAAGWSAESKIARKMYFECEQKNMKKYFFSEVGDMSKHKETKLTKP